MKLVKEYINFERNLDPKDSMNIGDMTIRNLNKIERSLKYASEILKKEFNITINGITQHKSELEKGDIYTNELEFTHSKIKDNLFIGCNYNTVTKKIQYWIEPDIFYFAGYFNYIDECIDIYREFFKNNFEIKESHNFERGLEPKVAMGIGMRNTVIYFKNANDIINWTIHNLPLILGTKEIPKDIIYPSGSKALFNEWYYSELDKYFRNYIKFNDKEFSFESIIRSVRNILREMGYPKD